MTYRPKLIEVALPLDAINEASAKEKSIRHGHPSTLHLWWARRPLAACRAVLFGQLVDDPSGWPEEFPTEEAQDKERERIFDIIRELVIWENSNNPETIYKARLEIARTFARRDRYAAQAEGIDSDNIIEMMTRPPAADVYKYLATRVPPVHDPFAGGGSIPLEAQRLGLRAIASDLNPVAVLLNKAMIEIPSLFSNQAPVNAEARRDPSLIARSRSGVAGLAEDVRHYCAWIQEEAGRRIGHLHAPILVTSAMAEQQPALAPLVGESLTVVAWLWTRTVRSPDPAFPESHVPLTSTYVLSAKTGNAAHVVPVVSGATYRFTVRNGVAPDSALSGTKLGRGANFRCLVSGAPIAASHVYAEATAGRMGARLMAVVADGSRGRVYLAPTSEIEALAASAQPNWRPDVEIPKNPRWFSPPLYGLTTYADIFTPRQLVALTTFSDLVAEARARVEADAAAAGLVVDGRGLEDGGQGARAYADAVAVFLALATDRLADRNSSLCGWDLAQAARGREATVRNVFARQAMPMTWDFAEVSVLAETAGSFDSAARAVVRVLERLDSERPRGRAEQADARLQVASAGACVSTDPPYYDNIGYADLSDFFYVWLRRALRPVLPKLFSTVAVPKAAELVATPYRHGGKAKAEEFFLDGMTEALRRVAEQATRETPVAIYYAFKQSEDTGEGGTSSTGWETFLSAAIEAGFAILGTWPMRTELGNRLVGNDTNALASSVVLVCRSRAPQAPSATRREFVEALKRELPRAIGHLQRGHIAPVDLAQSAIGPGIGVFTRFGKVLEADGTSMTVRTALALINGALDEFLSESEGELDSDSRFAVSWFETYGYETGPFGVAENIAKGRNVSVSGVAEAGILTASAGKVRLHRRAELPTDWTPANDKHLTVWEATQHLIKRHEEVSEEAAAELLKALGPVADQARALAYRLYSACERRKWAEEARAYNGLVVAWPELERLASQVVAAPAKPATKQGKLF